MFTSLGALALGAGVFGHAPDALAADPPKAEILVIHATKCEKKTVDPAIVGEPPPSAMGFDCLKLVEKKVVPLPINQANTTKLPNGRTFQLVLTEHVANRYKMTASINAANGGWTKLADVTADPNKRFNVGGWMHQGGAIVLTIRILP